MKALRRFTVRAHLPDRLAALDQLSTNLRWSWEKATQDLFASIDPALWASCGNDPVAVLGAVKPARLDELALDEEFLRRLDEQAADLNDYLSRPLWYQQQEQGYQQQEQGYQQQEQAGTAAASGLTLPASIAYFSMEFGIAEVLPNYSGGLGILAGDHLKAASDLGLPLIAVGLYYRSGYFRQSLTADGWQQETYPSLDPHGLPLRLLTHSSGDPVLVELALPDSAQLRARIWVAQVGRVPLLLLDSDIPENEHELRSVTDRLYGVTRNTGSSRRSWPASVGYGQSARSPPSRGCRPRGLPHERGSRRVPGSRTHPGTHHRFGIGLRYRADGGAVQHGVHHAHSGASRYRPVPGGHGAALLRR
ncbi:hypothetical protein NIIDMKKI_18680 [Mycobacterium kansasii]|uniref:DUF3417 domain-containing protein n=1 Tax=Mycobacterium kansasii TaxID=1768 RepID=A0A7G1I9Y9_MYCKA|nr:hypothetical protein NIIDMKKI_18680 [Mycobacterium kansasii]